MTPIGARRLACSAIASAGFAFSVVLAAILLTASGALADLEDQPEIETAIAKYEEAVKQARDNIPDSAKMKGAEDELDRKSRAKMDAEAKLEATRRAKAGEGEIAKAERALNSAEAAEMKAREEADAAYAAEASEADKERAKNYREALEKRRDARKMMQALFNRLRPKVGEARAHGYADELLLAINRLQGRIKRAEQPITPQSVAALIPFLPMTANVATDSPELCTFGKATPTSVVLEPSDGDGNSMKRKLDGDVMRALAALSAPPRGGGPINISNPDPDNPAKQNKPEKAGAGPATAAGGPQAPGPGAADPKTAGKPDATPAQPTRPAASGPSTGPAGTNLLDQSILDQIDESAAPVAQKRPADTPAASTGPKRPADSGLSLMGSKLPNGQAPEDELDRIIKLAEEARARGDKSSFDFYRSAAQAVARWVQLRISESLPQGPEAWELFFPAPKDATELAKRAQMQAAIDLHSDWHQYENELSTWKLEPHTAPPGAAAGQSIATPKPASSPAAEANPAATPQRPAAAGEKSAPAPEKSAANEKGKADLPDKTPDAAADPGGISTGNVIIFFKATESVLQGGPQGDENKTVMAKFTAPEPALPKTGQTRTAKAKLDTGHDRSPVTCNTGKDGRCKAQIPADERESYGLPALPPAAGLQDKSAARADKDPLLELVKADSAIQASQNYSVELPSARNTGMVIQKGPAKLTETQLAALEAAPPGVQVQRSDFKIGNKAYTRVGFTGPTALTAEAAKKLADRFGNDAQIDHCGEKAPGPPLGMTPVSFSALNSELPQATVDLRQSVRSDGTTR